MADFALDDVLRELDAAIASANARLQIRNRMRWRRCFGLDGDGDLRLQVPSLGADGWRTLQVPLESLMCRRGLSVAELRVEIGCAVSIRRPSASSGALRIVADPGVRNPMHRLELRLHDGLVEVWLDGVALRRGRSGEMPLPKATSPPRSRLWKWPYPRVRLLLEGEDARRTLAAIGPVLVREAGARRRRLGLLLFASASLATLAAAVLYRVLS